MMGRVIKNGKRQKELYEWRVRHQPTSPKTKEKSSDMTWGLDLAPGRSHHFNSRIILFIAFKDDSSYLNIKIGGVDFD